MLWQKSRNRWNQMFLRTRQTGHRLKLKRCTDPCCHPLGTVSHRVKRGKKWNLHSSTETINWMCHVANSACAAAYRFSTHKTWKYNRNDEYLKQYNQNRLVHLQEDAWIFSKKAVLWGHFPKYLAPGWTQKFLHRISSPRFPESAATVPGDPNRQPRFPPSPNTFASKRARDTTKLWKSCSC